ncbi:MAG TPA: DUF2791 family P-loop domain-containing protein [Candidatus Cloacimonadota bacterium]|nr:DUF2791 family P-loop domain-containing protein [Candidatus Cloacimonadota bacterium]
MFDLNPVDLAALQKGLPPQSDDLIKHLCVQNDWLRLLQDYCLDQFIAGGGSKLKILHGNRGTGKSHYLKFIGAQARDRGYFSLYLNLMDLDFFLSDPVQLYKAVASRFETERLQQALIQMILGELGHSVELYEVFDGNLPDFLCEMENAAPQDAKREIRKAINKVVNGIGVDFSFRKFLHVFCEAVAGKDAGAIEIAAEWLKGEKIPRILKNQSSLYEALNQSNARIWLYSLTELILLSGYRGLVILIDQLEAIMPQSTARMRYTPMRRNDVYELLRQLIDDLDFFHHTLIMIAADDACLEHERYGLQSYHALWMRIQPGFIIHEAINPYADLIDANMLLAEAAQNGELAKLSAKFSELSHNIPHSFSSQKGLLDEAYIDFRVLVQNWLGYSQPEADADEQN